MRWCRVVKVVTYIIQTVPGDLNYLPADARQPEEEAVPAQNKNAKSVISIALVCTPDTVWYPRNLLSFVLPVSPTTSLMPCTLGA